MAHLDHTGPGHGDATLALTEVNEDGSMLFQSWGICSCGLQQMREKLGPPRMESYATAEQVLATGLAVMDVPGVTRIGEGLG
ncbi:hypothetical protein AB0K40_18065 [Nonomuraea bangladeshensis]|uniref:Uncharacterized protein n=1 Tax=Nonomuraea bangladeshensis TaxID=404385 RepID=A0ABV3H4F7_9ACTN